MALKTRSSDRKRARAARDAARAGIHASPVFIVSVGLLFLLPVFFTPGQLVEEFEFTKVSLLVTGALVLAAWWLAAESSRIAAGFVDWLRALPGRAAAAVRREPLGGAIALCLLSATASTLASVRPMLSLYGAPQSHAGLRTVLALAAIYYASRSLTSNPSWIYRVAQAAGAGAAVATAYSLLQIAHLDPITWARQSEFQGLLRAGSTVGHVNTLSAYLVMCLPLVLFLATRARSRAASIAWLTLAAASLFVVVASLSRGAWLGTAAVALVALTLVMASGRRLPRGRVLVVLAILAVGVLIPLATPMRAPLLGRVRQLTDLSSPTTQTRLELWRAGIRMFEAHPLLGAGLDAYLAAFPPYRTRTLTQIEWGGTPAKAHNDLIQILATQGLLGVVAALAVVILCARAVWRVARHGNPEARAAAVAVGAALVGYVAPNLVGFGTVASSALAAALAGWAARAARTSEPGAHTAESHAGARGSGGGYHREGPPVRSAWNLGAGVALAAAAWFFLVGKPLAAEINLARALRYPPATFQRDEFLARASAIAPWDPRYSAELGRSYFYEALREPNPDTRWSLLLRARETLAKSIEAAPENGENRLLFASVVTAQEAVNPAASSKDEVREAYRRAVALDPLSPSVLVGAERGLLAAGLDQDARALALRCAEAYPDYAPPLADLGSIALEQGRTAAAAETLKLALQRKWRTDVAGAANAWNDLARANLALGQYEQAIAAADSALARNSKLSQAFATQEAAKRAMSRKGNRG